MPVRDPRQDDLLDERRRNARRLTEELNRPLENAIRARLGMPACDVEPDEPDDDGTPTASDVLLDTLQSKLGMSAVPTDDEPPQDQADPRSTREIAAAAMRTTIADREAPDESGTPAAAPDDGFAALNAAIALNDGEAMKKALLQIEEADQPEEPDQPGDTMTAAVNRRLRRKDNKGRAHFGLLPNQEEE